MLGKQLFFLLIIIGFKFATGQPNELDSLKTVVNLMPEDSLKCETYLRIADLLYSGEESEWYANKALRLSKNLNSPRLIGRSYHRLAWCHGLDEMDKKTAYLDSATIRFTSIADNYGLGSVYDTKGTILMAYGSISEALKAYQQAYDFYSKIPDSERQAGVLNNWAIAEYTGGNTKEALYKFQKALDYRITEKPISHIDIARLYQGLGECHRINGDMEMAATNYLKGYEHRNAVENIGVVESMLSLASLIYEAAERKMDTLAIVGLVNDYGFVSSLHLIESAEKTRGIADRIGMKNAIMDVRRQRNILNKDFKAAYEILLKQKQLQEEYKLSESSLEAMADMKVKFEKDQLKIKLLEEEVVNQKSQDRMTMLLFSLGALLLIAIIGLLYYQNRVKTGQLKLNEAHREQQIVSMRSMLEGQEKERSRIARDLHDGLGNLLSTLKVNIGSLQINFDDKNSKKIYGSASQMIDEACIEVRKIAHEMMPQALKKLGLRKALEDLVLKMDAIHEFDAEFHVHGKERIFDDSTNVMLFRIVQEALNNIVRYAKAKEVSVQITYSEDWFDLTIEDDGIGFDPNALDTDKGMGLKSIAFRTEFIKGTYDLTSRPGVGTLVTINIPLNNIPEA
ncbi:sensor histidine kinase [Maribacter polysiphoniae]|uniref:histidine kinase n=2 Tax=Maribacter polysiphoniae TaxID=429344 RepID=A0A316DU05_9FLAO|nr:sensor histidine kinase [Maribacter polysiphoniae]MBD1262178.1 sensor histidine kinase [Maribacter polysiphoniae]PWK21561.1 histidine kinase/DNA gyrase B/HSP90-like ATPase [Maribacter polysiphoniae]